MPLYLLWNMKRLNFISCYRNIMQYNAVTFYLSNVFIHSKTYYIPVIRCRLHFTRSFIESIICRRWTRLRWCPSLPRGCPCRCRRGNLAQSPLVHPRQFVTTISFIQNSFHHVFEQNCNGIHPPLKSEINHLWSPMHATYYRCWPMFVSSWAPRQCKWLTNDDCCWCLLSEF